MLDGIVGDEGYKVKLIVEANLFVRFHHFNYSEDDRFNTFSFHLLSHDVVDNVTKVSIEDVLRAAQEEIYSCIKKESKKNFEGVKSLRFKLIVDEPV